METKNPYKVLKFLNWWIDEVWCIGYKEKDYTILEKEDRTLYRVLQPTYKYWYADPMPVMWNGRRYVFMEVYDRFKRKGFIGLSELKNGRLTRPIKVIEEEYHMSYPFVFDYNGSLFMCPETHEAKQIRIYRMKENIHTWELYKVFDVGEELSDTNVYHVNGNLRLINTSKRHDNPYMTRLHLFEISNFMGECTLKELDSVEMKKEYAYNNRNGGNIGEKYRVIQQAEYGWYGKDVVIRELQQHEATFVESGDLICYSLDNIRVKNSSKKQLMGIHTYSFQENLETIDINIRQISFIKFHNFILKHFRRR